MTTITEFAHKFAKKPSQVHEQLDAAGFRKIALGMTHVVKAKKDDASVFTLCEYGPQDNRQKSNITAITGIILDIDGDNTPEQLVDAFARLEHFAYWGYTTYQHSEDISRWRIVVPLADSVTADEFEHQSLALRLAEFLGLKVDECCAKAAQVYYLPTKPTESAECDISVGDSTTLFDLALLPAQAAKPGKVSSRKTDDEQLELYQQIDAIKDRMFDGVAPMYFGGKFLIYLNGVWHEVDSGPTFARDLIETHARKVGILQVTTWTAAMKILWSVENRPSAVSNKITLTNGTLNTDTCELEPHSPENYHYSGMDFAYDPNAKCPLWLKTLDDIFLPDADKVAKIKYLQFWFGYLLIASTKYHLMVWLYGSGANGKSIITQIARQLLGLVNVSSIPLTQLGARFIGAELLGKLANIVDEIATNGLMQEDELKKIVSGDPIQVERKNKDPFVFSPVARIFAATNTLPPSKDSTHGLDRRLTILTCNRTFKPEEMDRDLASKLTAELPGIFVWALEGLVQLTAQGKFPDVPSCIAAMEDFKVCRNSVSLFKRDCLQVPSANDAAGTASKAFRVQSHELYKTYKSYCSANTYQAFGKEGFGKKLKELGIEQIRSGGKRYYLAKAVNLEEAGLGDTQFVGYRNESINDAFGGLDVA